MSIPAPVGGWDAGSPLADMPEDRAVVLDNWFPSTGDVRVRRGYQAHAAGMGSGVVDSLLVYNGLTSASSALFAATGGAIYDVSSGGTSSSVLTGLSSNRWQYTNFTTSAGKFLWICNGADNPRHYNGSVWATPSLSVTTYSASDIINVNAHKNRLWFVFNNSTVAGYLATGAIAGTVTNFELGGQFTRGGYLVAMGTMTRDGGAGEDDLAVFISSRGQCAVYAGTDPASANTWALVGVYDVGPPIGYRCFTKVGGDLALINIDGVLPLSKGLEVDRAAAANVVMTARINSVMNESARSYSTNFGWELVPYAKGTMVILNVPITEGQVQQQYVMNTLTGAWCRFKNQNANCWAVFRDRLFFGGNTGLVYEADAGSVDVDTPVDAIGQTAYSYYKTPGTLKQWKLLQPLITTDADSRPALGISTDYKDNASLGTPTSAATASALYDTAIWDVDIYGAEARNVSDWTGVSGIGHCASIHFRARTGPDGVSVWGSAEWGEDLWSRHAGDDVVQRLNGFNVVFERGGYL
jgi:hypothetical protein